MILRTLKWTLGVGAALLSPLAAAIGLGELQLRSAMEERFAADIELLQIGDLNEHQMTVGLAPPEDFERAGLERDFQLSDLRFRVDLSNPARPVIKVTSRRPIHEPYLNFLVELRWPSGRLLREYTALLDLPTFAGAVAPGKTSAATAPVAAEPRSVSVDSSPRPASGAARVTSGIPGSGRVQVQAGDTLWAIAQRYQAAGATIYQAVEAIAAENPDAFIHGDIHRIRRGAWLRIPDAATMRASAPRQVTPSPRKPSTTPPSLESQPATVPAPAGVQPEGELRLTAAGSGTTTGTAETAESTDIQTSAAGIAGVLEERDRLQRENEELRSRVRSLEAQLNAAGQLVQIEAPGLAALSEAPAVAEPGAAPAVSEPQAAAQAGVDGAPQTPIATPPEAVTPAAQEPEPTPPTAIPPTPEAKRSPLAVFTQVDDWLIPALGAIAALLLGLLVFAGMRRGSGVQQRGLELPREVDAPPPSRHDPQRPATLEPADAELFAEPAPSDEAAAILNEADVCLSFGHQDQAEQLLREGLERYPKDTKLHLKLLEVLVASGDRGGFEAQLPRLAALGDLDAFAAAQALQSQFPAGEQILAAVPASSDGSATAATEIPLDEFDLGLELDLDAAAGSATPAAATLGETSALELTNLEDFDLGLEQIAGAEPDSGAAAMPIPELEDLDLFEPGQEIATQLELASAYVEMGDTEGAREILDHVIEVGDVEQQDAARQLLARLG